MRPLTHRRSRRGVLLLVVLSLLVLMSMISLTFVMMTRQARIGAHSQTKVDRYGDDPARQLDNAMLELLRGTNKDFSAVKESLLMDMYGGSTRLTIKYNPPASPAWVPPSASGPTQFLDLELDDPTNALSKQDGYFNGCVFTANVNGTERSTRVVGYHYDLATGQRFLRVVTFEGLTSFNQIQTSAIVNWRPFGGSGWGRVVTTESAPGQYDVMTLDAYSLLPNLPNVRNRPTEAGPHEEYDAPDAQNPLLAAYVPNPASGRIDIMPTLHRPDLVHYWLQRLYDAKIPLDENRNPVNGWTITWPNSFSEADKWGAIFNPLRPPKAIDKPTRDTILAVKKAIIFRPLRELHPSFNGSNAASSLSAIPSPIVDASKNLNPYWELYGPWDVDNDGDGVADSVWVDLGVPVQTGPDGRLFKPLFAVLCLDMDGRGNVNAHGDIAHLDPSYLESLVMPTTPGKPKYGPQLAGSPGSISEPRGMGYGTAEISLANLFVSDSNAKPAWILGGNTTPIIGVTYEGRYGESQFTGNLPYGASTNLPPFPGDTSVKGPAKLSWVKQFEAMLWNPGATPPQLDAFSQSAYASPHDLYGAGTVLLDKRGQPLNLGMNTVAVDIIHTPYEMDLSRRTVRATRTLNSVDSPFTPAELERVLRPYDVDSAALPSRLTDLLNPTRNTAQAELHRLAVTTDSYDVPTSGMLPTREMRLDPSRGGNPHINQINIVEMYAAKLQSGMASRYPMPAQREQMVQIELRKMFAPEWMAGLKLDLNRPFGNGSDDDKNGIVDEPSEFAAAREGAWKGLLPGNQSVPFDPSNGVYSPKLPPGIVARQQMARQIFTLMLLLRNPGAMFGVDADRDNNITEVETVDTLAQWAINVVDFRDRDSTCTPFEYDRNPWDGWDVDGDLGTTNDQAGVNRGVVWGCERPEMIFDEAFAMHDRRTENLGTGKQKYDPQDPASDRTYDQRLRPQGSLFFGLMNPWSGLQEMPAGEFSYALPPQTPGWRNGIILNKRNANNDPVWRVQVVRGPNKFADPDDPVPSRRPKAAYNAAQFSVNTEVERSVYFAGAPPARYNGQGLVYYGNPGKMAMIPPGRYAVVGPAARTVIGRRTDVQDDPANPGAPVDLKYNLTRQIDLTPAALPDANKVEVLNNPGEPPTGDVPAAVAVIIDQTPDPADATKSIPARLSISEPIGTALDPFYPTTTVGGWDPALSGGEGAWTNPIDDPLDAKRPGDFSELAKNQTLLNFRVLHLQRLADPSLPWNPEPRTETGAANPAHNPALLVNPYLTIDSIPVDLTCFNGVTDDTDDPKAGGNDDPGRSALSSHQRGETSDVAGSNNLWKQELPHTRLQVPQPPFNIATGHFFDFPFEHTLGYINRPFWPYYTAATAPADPRDTALAKFYAGAPQDVPFRWLNWNNRPYISAHELLLVPAARTSQLLGMYPRLLAVPPGAPAPTGYEVAVGNPFSHLVNFFASVDNAAGSAYASNLCRLFDFVGVNSRWVGTENMVNPGACEPYVDANNNGVWDSGEPYSDTNGNGRCDSMPGEWNFWSLMRAPFNKVSNYRDPGAININTVSNELTWEDIFHGPPAANTTRRHPGPGFAQLLTSRRGWQAAGNLPFGVDARYPSVFGRPFRSANGAVLGLYDSPQRTDGTAKLPISDIDVTLMRPEDPTSKSAPLALFRFDGAQPQYLAPNLANDPARNPYFAYQALRRNSNLFTTRSNVYAVWITVGRFEVLPASINAVPPFTPPEFKQLFPDGYMLGPELGAETGEIVRHRAFYLIDRTIPVGFELGQNHNVEQTVLLKRFIE